MTSMLASILKWSLTQGQSEDSTTAGNATPMSDADRAWLKEALESVMVNAVKRIKQLVVVISLPESEEGISKLLMEHGTASAAAQAKQNEANNKTNAASASSSSSSTSSATAVASSHSAPSAASSTSSSVSSTPLPQSSTRPLPLGLPPSETIYSPQPSSSLPSSSSSSPPRAVSSSSPSASASSPPPSAELLSKTHTEIVAMKRTALEEVEDLVSHLDHADDFVSIGGLPHLLTLFHSNDAAIRWRAAAVLSTLIDNHQKTADAALKLKALEQVIRLLQPPVSSLSSSSSSSAAAAAPASTSDEWLCVAKCLGCLSAFLRSETKAAEVFLTLHGPVRVAALLSHSPPAAVLRKTFSVLRLCLTTFPSTSALFVPAAPTNSTTAPALLSFCPTALRSSDLNVREECARFLARLCATPALANSVGDDALGIRTAVNGRLKAIEAADAEERESMEDERQALAEVARLCQF